MSRGSRAAQTTKLTPGSGAVVTVNVNLQVAGGISDRSQSQLNGIKSVTPGCRTGSKPLADPVRAVKGVRSLHGFSQIGKIGRLQPHGLGNKSENGQATGGDKGVPHGWK